MDFFEVSAKEETNLLTMLFSSVVTLPFFSTLTGDVLNKEELVNELEKENNDNVNNQDDENNLGIGNEAKNKKLNVNNSKRANSNLPENSVDQSDINTVGDNNKLGLEKNKKKRKCC